MHCCKSRENLSTTLQDIVSTIFRIIIIIIIIIIKQVLGEINSQKTSQMTQLLSADMHSLTAADCTVTQSGREHNANGYSTRGIT